MKIAIIGGGPAGLIAGLAAQRAGLDAIVFEQTENFRRIGGGILIHSNGLRVLNALGVLEGFEGNLRATQRLRALLSDGRSVGDVDYAGLPVPQNRCGVVMRYILHEYLFEAARDRGIDVRMGHRLEALNRQGSEVELRFANGQAWRAAIVVACDGINSATRTASGIAARKTAINEAYLRAISDRPTADTVIRELWGDDGRRFGICPLLGDRTYIFCNVPLGQWNEIRDHRLDAWIDTWTPFGAEVLDLLRKVSDWNAVSYDELHEVRLDRWAKPPIFVAGDAAHAMTPNLGQGANSSMVDALVLMRILGKATKDGTPLDRAAAEYEGVRRKFATSIQTASHLMGVVASWRSPLARRLRNAILIASQASSALRRRSELLGIGYNPAEDQYLEPF
ncbi:MAG TPA: NAD(P)/FAD-dependent oxidoreductase [Candidatus Binataceae bacterium]|nr:NAD(P)/FAD-dependent oxidoreductase [Candidatus Binataceae bacterium]